MTRKWLFNMFHDLRLATHQNKNGETHLPTKLTVANLAGILDR